MTIVFQSSSPKIPKQGIFGPKFWHSHFFTKFTKLDKFQGADFKCDKILSQKYPNKAFLVPNLGIFVFLQSFAIRQI